MLLSCSSMTLFEVFDEDGITSISSLIREDLTCQQKPCYLILKKESITCIYESIRKCNQKTREPQEWRLWEAAANFRVGGMHRRARPPEEVGAMHVCSRGTGTTDFKALSYPHVDFNFPYGSKCFKQRAGKEGPGRQRSVSPTLLG